MHPSPAWLGNAGTEGVTTAAATESAPTIGSALASWAKVNATASTIVIIVAIVKTLRMCLPTIACFRTELYPRIDGASEVIIFSVRKE